MAEEKKAAVAGYKEHKKFIKKQKDEERKRTLEIATERTLADLEDEEDKAKRAKKWIAEQEAERVKGMQKQIKAQENAAGRARVVMQEARTAAAEAMQAFLDPKAAAAREREQQKTERRFERTLDRARRKQEQGRRLTRRERAAVQLDEARKAELAAEKHLKDIDVNIAFMKNKIGKLLELK